MSIEIRQLVIKTTVKDDAPRPPAVLPDAMAELRREILLECQRLIRDAIARAKER